jgi:CheY-like chemotaxis protein
MKDKKHILVADNSGESLSNLGFLLQLSGFSITSFGDEIEAINWLLQQDSTSVIAQMLLINQPLTQRTLLSLLFQLRQKFPDLQLLLVNPVPLPLSGAITELDPPLHQCSSSEVYTRVKTIFHGNSHPAKKDNSRHQQDQSHPSGRLQAEPIQEQKV